MDIKFKLRKLYYKYINTSIINHYRLLIITEDIMNIGKNYFLKYPNASSWFNLNKKLFEKNKQAIIDHSESSKKQNELVKLFFENREIVCKNSDYHNSIICSEKFQLFYVDKKYHYTQCLENVINDIIKDIKNNE